MATPAKVPRHEDGEAKEEILADFGSFQFERVLSENSERRVITVLGRFPDSPSHPEAPAVVLLEKTPFGGEEAAKKVLTGDARLKVHFRNDIYGKYDCFVGSSSGKEDHPANCIKASVIHPATQKHIRKYESSAKHLVMETPALYRALTLPYLEGEKFDNRWIYNILNHKKESETIVFEDTDCDDGFVLLPDYKWNGKQLEDLYLVALTVRRDVKSIRDLKEEHLPLLRNMWENGCKAIHEKYGLPQSQIRAYFHYQPSFYHLHVHFTLASYNAPGSSVEGAHLLPVVIRNIEADPAHYQRATLPFPVKESDNLFAHYKKGGYAFGEEEEKEKDSLGGFLSFFRDMGRAKHEPCGEHWAVTYGESAWRMALMALCLPRDLDRGRLVRQALSSAFTSMGTSSDHNSEWKQKLAEVRAHLARLLPRRLAMRLYSTYASHADARRGLELNSREARAYRKLMEFEETLLLWEEMRKEGENPSPNVLVKKMCEVGFPGTEKVALFGDVSEVERLLKFLLQASVLVGLRRTGWVRSEVPDPETVASHMFRMGVMAMATEGVDEGRADKGEDGTLGDAVVLSVLHDVAECIVGDITPKDKVPEKEKHEREMEAMRALVKDLPGPLAKELFTAFERYEMQREGDAAAPLVKDLDKFDMILQADEYEANEPERSEGRFLQEFFDSTESVFKTERVKRMAAALREERQARTAAGTKNGAANSQ